MVRLGPAAAVLGSRSTGNAGQEVAEMRSRNQVVVLALVASTVASCAPASTAVRKPPHAQRNTRPRVVERGDFRGVGWQLLAYERAGHLCLELDPAGSRQPSRNSFVGACEFDQRDPSAGFFAAGPGPGSANVAFGPTPWAVTSVQVATHQFVPTVALPARVGAGRARVWVRISPADWPAPRDGAPLPQPVFYSNTGHEIPPRPF